MLVLARWTLFTGTRERRWLDLTMVLHDSTPKCLVPSRSGMRWQSN